MRILELKSMYPGVPSLEIEWDQARGRISGRDSARVIAEIKRMRILGGIPLRIPCCSVAIERFPLKSASQFAAIVGYAHWLPEDLEAVYPDVEDNTPEGALN